MKLKIDKKKVEPTLWFLINTGLIIPFRNWVISVQKIGKNQVKSKITNNIFMNCKFLLSISQYNDYICLDFANFLDFTIEKSFDFFWGLLIMYR